MAVENQEKFDQLQAVMDWYKPQKGALMPVMQQAQGIFGYLPIEVQNFIAEGMGVPLTEVYGVATFYSQFTMQPKGKNTVGVCMGTACYVKGSDAILRALREALGVSEGKTTEDGLFTLEATRCLGCCGLAPVIMINEDVYGRLSADDIPGIINKYRGTALQ